MAIPLPIWKYIDLIFLSIVKVNKSEFTASNCSYILWIDQVIHVICSLLNFETF